MAATKKVLNPSKWRQEDKTLGWLKEKYPHLAAWREVAVKWIKDQSVNPRQRLAALSIFFDRYLVGQRLPVTPAELLSRNLVLPDKRTLPDFHKTACSKGEAGIGTNNNVHDFIEFVLSQDEFTVLAEDGKQVTCPGFRNPVPPVFYGNRARARGERRSLKTDKDIGWLKEKYPQLNDWRELALKEPLRRFLILR